MQGFTFLKSKFQIGSCKGPINFKPSENVFHVDDIPPVKKAKKKEVCWHPVIPFALMTPAPTDSDF